jgi:hypothetical protein
MWLLLAARLDEGDGTLGGAQDGRLGEGGDLRLFVVAHGVSSEPDVGVLPRDVEDLLVARDIDRDVSAELSCSPLATSEARDEHDEESAGEEVFDGLHCFPFGQLALFVF